jgi:DNA-binding beta-propeller fold protein YncE
MPSGPVAVVSNSLGNSLSVLDLTTRAVVGTYPVGITPLAENGPHHLGIADGAVFTALSFPAPAIAPGPHAAHGSSQVPGVLVRRSLTDFALEGQATVEPNPGEMVLSPDGRRVFVSHYDLLRALANVGNREAQLSRLLAVDTRTMRVTARVPLCVAAHGMVFAPDGRTLYAACPGDDALAVVDTSQETLTAQSVTLVPLRERPASGSPTTEPYAVGISPDGATVWVGCINSASGSPLLAFDTAQRRWDPARSLRRLGGTPYFPAFSADGRTMVVPLQNRDGVMRVRFGDPVELTPVALPMGACTLPHQVSLGPDGRYYLVCEGVHTATRIEPGSVLALNPDTLEMEARYEVGGYPDAIVFRPGAR